VSITCNGAGEGEGVGLRRQDEANQGHRRGEKCGGREKRTKERLQRNSWAMKWMWGLEIGEGRATSEQVKCFPSHALPLPRAHGLHNVTQTNRETNKYNGRGHAQR